MPARREVYLEEDPSSFAHMHLGSERMDDDCMSSISETARSLSRDELKHLPNLFMAMVTRLAQDVLISCESRDRIGKYMYDVVHDAFPDDLRTMTLVKQIWNSLIILDVWSAPVNREEMVKTLADRSIDRAVVHDMSRIWSHVTSIICAITYELAYSNPAMLTSTKVPLDTARRLILLRSVQLPSAREKWKGVIRAVRVIDRVMTPKIEDD